MQETIPNKDKLLATLSAGMAAAFVPQFGHAALVTVGGDGGTGSVTLTGFGDTTNLGGVLANSLTLDGSTSYFSSYLAGVAGAGDQRLFAAHRSSVSADGSVRGSNWTFVSSGSASEGAALGSDDNWVPGHFTVAGVNGGDLIWGWLQVELGTGGFGGSPVTILSLTYDDAATDTTSFVKPIGGFPAAPVPEPSTLSLAALALGAAGVLRRRRRLQAEAGSVAH